MLIGYEPGSQAAPSVGPSVPSVRHRPPFWVSVPDTLPVIVENSVAVAVKPATVAWVQVVPRSVKVAVMSAKSLSIRSGLPAVAFASAYSAATPPVQARPASPTVSTALPVAGWKFEVSGV